MTDTTQPPAETNRRVHHREPAGATRCGMGGINARRETRWEDVTCRACLRVARAYASADGERSRAEKLDQITAARSMTQQDTQPPAETLARKPLPCPFCGEKPHIEDGRNDRPWVVQCVNSDCPAQPFMDHADTRREAVQAWNTRAALTRRAGGDAIPAGMKPWSGGIFPPEDWDGGKVLLADGDYESADTLYQDSEDTGSNQWHHRRPGGIGCDIIAYTPKPSAGGDVIPAGASAVMGRILGHYGEAPDTLARIKGMVAQYREAPFRSAEWLAGEIMRILDSEPANDTTPKPPAGGDAGAVERERDEARQIVRDIYWMARRYADGRQSYAVGMFNDAVRKAYDAGWLTHRMNDEPAFARDGMFSGEWKSIEQRARDAEERLAALALPAGGDAIPAGMKPWHGGDAAPGDFDYGHVQFSDGIVGLVSKASDLWSRTPVSGRHHVIAYTPKPPAGGDAGAVEDSINAVLERWDAHSGDVDERKRLIARLRASFSAEGK